MVRDNIRYSRQDASDDVFMAAAEKAAAHDFIVGLKDLDEDARYDSKVGERGVKLSGGEHQRLKYARVILKDVPILLLDEATSALVIKIETEIQ